MPYKLFVDKNEAFECEVAVKNASLKGSIARLVVESDDGPCFIFKGVIQGDKCVIPIKRLKGLLDEHVRGKMHLEMVVEDTYFRPWESEFIVEEHTSVKVRVNETKSSSGKPILEVKVAPIKKQTVKQSKGINVWVPLKEISSICESFNICKRNIRQRKGDLFQIVREYFRANPEYNKHASSILSKIPNVLN
jgi:hypothetical protein